MSKIQLDLFVEKKGVCSEIKFMGRDDEGFDFEIAEIDQNGCFLKQIYCWWPGDELPNQE